jgi:hypothetical protein
VILNNGNNPFGGTAGGTLTLAGGALQVANVIGLNPLTLPNPVALSNANFGFVPSAALGLVFSGPVTLTGTNTLAVPQNATVTFSGAVGGTGSLVETGGGSSSAPGGPTPSGGGTLVLTNASNNYGGGTTLVNQGVFVPALTLGGGSVLGSGPLTLAGGIVQASAPVSVPNAVALAEASVAMNGIAPNDQPITFSGSVSVTGINQITTALTPVTFSGTVSGSGALGAAGSGALSMVLTGNNTLTGVTAALGGASAVNGTQTSSPAMASGGTLGGTGAVGTISAGYQGVVSPGSPPTAVGTLQGAGANFSNAGTLELQIKGTTTPGGDYDRLDLGSNALVLGGTSRLVLDLSGLTGPGTAQGVVLYGSRTGNVPVFSEVDVINNPNDFAVELDYTATALNVKLAAAADHLAFGQQTTNTLTGVAVRPAVTVQVRDRFGNLLTVDNSDQVTLTVASGPGGFAPGSTTTATVSGGVATFSNLVFSTPGTYTLSASGSGGLTGPNSASFAVSWPPIALAQSPQVNGASAALAGPQRSMVDSIAYTFNHAVALGANAFTIALHQNVTVNGTTGQTVGTLPTLSYSSPDGGVTWVVTFSGAGVVGNSIADGVYDLTLNHAAVTDTQGQTLAADRVDTFYRLYGDTNGDGTVNNADTFKLRATFGLSAGGTGFLAYLDYNGDGTVNNADVFQFRRRFGTTYGGFTASI